MYKDQTFEKATTYTCKTNQVPDSSSGFEAWHKGQASKMTTSVFIMSFLSSGVIWLTTCAYIAAYFWRKYVLISFQLDQI